jgi:hypothetical protein
MYIQIDVEGSYITSVVSAIYCRSEKEFGTIVSEVHGI